MRPIFIDTNAYVAFKRGDPTALEIFQYAETIAISPIVLGELLGGFENGSKVQQNKKELQEFLASTRIRLFPITADTSVFYSTVFAQLKRKGSPIPTNDLWIAAQVLEQGCVLYTYDHHFHNIDGLVSGSALIDLMI